MDESPAILATSNLRQLQVVEEDINGQHDTSSTRGKEVVSTLDLVKAAENNKEEANAYSTTTPAGVHTGAAAPPASTGVLGSTTTATADDKAVLEQQPMCAASTRTSSNAASQSWLESEAQKTGGERTTQEIRSACATSSGEQYISRQMNCPGPSSVEASGAPSSSSTPGEINAGSASFASALNFWKKRSANETELFGSCSIKHDSRAKAVDDERGQKGQARNKVATSITSTIFEYYAKHHKDQEDYHQPEQQKPQSQIAGTRLHPEQEPVCKLQCSPETRTTPTQAQLRGADPDEEKDAPCHPRDSLGLPPAIGGITKNDKANNDKDNVDMMSAASRTTSRDEKKSDGASDVVVIADDNSSSSKEVVEVDEENLTTTAFFEQLGLVAAGDTTGSNKEDYSNSSCIKQQQYSYSPDQGGPPSCDYRNEVAPADSNFLDALLMKPNLNNPDHENKCENEEEREQRTASPSAPGLETYLSLQMMMNDEFDPTAPPIIDMVDHMGEDQAQEGADDAEARARDELEQGIGSSNSSNLDLPLASASNGSRNKGVLLEDPSLLAHVLPQRPLDEEEEDEDDLVSINDDNRDEELLAETGARDVDGSGAAVLNSMNLLDPSAETDDAARESLMMILQNSLAQSGSKSPAAAARNAVAPLTPGTPPGMPPHMPIIHGATSSGTKPSGIRGGGNKRAAPGDNAITFADLGDKNAITFADLQQGGSGLKMPKPNLPLPMMVPPQPQVKLDLVKDAHGNTVQRHTTQVLRIGEDGHFTTAPGHEQVAPMKRTDSSSSSTNKQKQVIDLTRMPQPPSPMRMPALSSGMMPNNKQEPSSSSAVSGVGTTSGVAPVEGSKQLPRTGSVEPPLTFPKPALPNVHREFTLSKKEWNLLSFEEFKKMLDEKANALCSDRGLQPGSQEAKDVGLTFSKDLTEQQLRILYSRLAWNSKDDHDQRAAKNAGGHHGGKSGASAAKTLPLPPAIGKKGNPLGGRGLGYGRDHDGGKSNTNTDSTRTAPTSTSNAKNFSAASVPVDCDRVRVLRTTFLSNDSGGSSKKKSTTEIKDPSSCCTDASGTGTTLRVLRTTYFTTDKVVLPSIQQTPPLPTPTLKMPIPRMPPIVLPEPHSSSPSGTAVQKGKTIRIPPHAALVHDNLHHGGATTRERGASASSFLLNARERSRSCMININPPIRPPSNMRGMTHRMTARDESQSRRTDTPAGLVIAQRSPSTTHRSVNSVGRIAGGKGGRGQQARDDHFASGPWGSAANSYGAGKRSGKAGWELHEGGKWGSGPTNSGGTGGRGAAGPNAITWDDMKQAGATPDVKYSVNDKMFGPRGGQRGGGTQWDDHWEPHRGGGSSSSTARGGYGNRGGPSNAGVEHRRRKGNIDHDNWDTGYASSSSNDGGWGGKADRDVFHVGKNKPDPADRDVFHVGKNKPDRGAGANKGGDFEFSAFGGNNATGRKDFFDKRGGGTGPSAKGGKQDDFFNTGRSRRSTGAQSNSTGDQNLFNTGNPSYQQQHGKAGGGRLSDGNSMGPPPKRRNVGSREETYEEPNAFDGLDLDAPGGPSDGNFDRLLEVIQGFS
ncbi:unnamed protein product [Amoebophrya sp. A120]|nr:unnamed protein product [Amoebophrya sp. A120]|eukprot:GSA120T00022821001.1